VVGGEAEYPAHDERQLDVLAIAALNGVAQQPHPKLGPVGGPEPPEELLLRQRRAGSRDEHQTEDEPLFVLVHRSLLKPWMLSVNVSNAEP